MSDAVAIFCAIAVAASVLRLAYVIRTAPERPYRHDEPREPWQGGEQP